MVKTPRAAAIAGIIFALLIATTTVLLRLSLPTDLSEADRWLTDSGLRGTVSFALNLVPFAGIFFLWFLGVIRDHLGEREDRFLATVLLGSGLLYVAMLFVAAAIGAGLITSIGSDTGSLVSSQAWEFDRNISLAVITIYGIKMAAVFTISSSTIFLRTGKAPRWICMLGYAVALVLLIGSSFTEWLSMLFYAWVFLVSLVFLAGSFRGEPDALDSGAAPAEEGAR